MFNSFIFDMFYMFYGILGLICQLNVSCLGPHSLGQVEAALSRAWEGATNNNLCTSKGFGKKTYNLEYMSFIL